MHGLYLGLMSLSMFADQKAFTHVWLYFVLHCSRRIGRPGGSVGIWRSLASGGGARRRMALHGSRRIGRSGAEVGI
jgi:hypothetical protein